MLKLNSQYAQTYLKQTSDNKRFNQTKAYGNPPPVISNERSRSRLPFENDIDIQNDYNYRDKYGKDNSRNDQVCNARNRGLIDKAENENINNSKPFNARQITRYREPAKSYAQIQKNYGQCAENNYERIKDRSPLYKQKSSADPSMDNYRQKKGDRQNEERQSYAGYSKYSGKVSVTEGRYLNSGKTNFMAKHNKRNEEIRSRILKEQQSNYGGGENYNKNKVSYDKNRQNDYGPDADEDYYAYLNNDTSPYMLSALEEEISHRKQDYSNLGQSQRPAGVREYQWKASQQTSDKKGGYNILNSQLSLELPANRKNYQDSMNSQERFDRPSLIQRKQIIKKSIENTPQRGYQGCKYEPGSSDRKKSLIEKSQMLQQKLKKLSTQYPNQKETTNHQHMNKDGNQQEERQGRQTPVSRIASSFNRGNSCLRNNFKNNNFTGETSVQLNVNPPKNIDGLRSRSPMFSEESALRQTSGHNNEAIDKIAKLNEKINERIQSIISNYANK